MARALSSWAYRTRPRCCFFNLAPNFVMLDRTALQGASELQKETHFPRRFIQGCACLDLHCSFNSDDHISLFQAVFQKYLDYYWLSCVVSKLLRTTVMMEFQKRLSVSLQQERNVTRIHDHFDCIDAQVEPLDNRHCPMDNDIVAASIERRLKTILRHVCTW